MTVAIRGGEVLRRGAPPLRKHAERPSELLGLRPRRSAPVRAPRHPQPRDWEF